METTKNKKGAKMRNTKTGKEFLEYLRETYVHAPLESKGHILYRAATNLLYSNGVKQPNSMRCPVLKEAIRYNLMLKGRVNITSLYNFTALVCE